MQSKLCFIPGSQALLTRGHTCNEEGKSRGLNLATNIEPVYKHRSAETNLARMWAGIKYDLDECVIALSQIVKGIGGRWLCTLTRKNHVWTVKLRVTYYFATSMASRHRISSRCWRTNWFSFEIPEFISSISQLLPITLRLRIPSCQKLWGFQSFPISPKKELLAPATSMPITMCACSRPLYKTTLQTHLLPTSLTAM